jgi:GNAT superfamily N-acetyltransferase
MEIQFLARVPEVIPEVSRWFRDQWKVDGLDRDPEEDFRGCARIPDLNCIRAPFAMVAMDHFRPLGTVFVLPTPPGSRDKSGPWISGLFVAKPHRHNGIGSALTIAAVNAAASLGHHTIYIECAGVREHFERFGWKYDRNVKRAGTEYIVLSKTLSPKRT